MSFAGHKKTPAIQPTIDPHFLSALADLSQALAVTIDIEQTLKQAVTRIADCMHAEAASVFLADAGHERLVCRACAGPVNVVGLSVPIDAGIVGRTFSSNDPQLVENTLNDRDFAQAIDERTGFRTRSILCVPLTTADGPIGVLQVLNKRDGALFAEADRDMLRALAAPTALAISNAALVKSLMEQNRIKRELQLARQMQRSLLPKRRRGNYPIQAINRPAREISGDFFDFFELNNGNIAFTIGDVSGKGLNAALLMARAASLLRWAGKDKLPPALWLGRVNEELAEQISGGMFVSAVAGYYHPKSRYVTWSNAGFPPALVHGPQGFVEYFADGPPLAIAAESTYAQQEMVLGKNTLYFFSDGVLDVKDAQGRRIGLEGAKALFSRHASADAVQRLRMVLRELRQLRLADDTTILMMEDRGT